MFFFTIAWRTNFFGPGRKKNRTALGKRKEHAPPEVKTMPNFEYDETDFGKVHRKRTASSKRSRSSKRSGSRKRTASKPLQNKRTGRFMKRSRSKSRSRSQFGAIKRAKRSSGKRGKRSTRSKRNKKRAARH